MDNTNNFEEKTANQYFDDPSLDSGEILPKKCIETTYSKINKETCGYILDSSAFKPWIAWENENTPEENGLALSDEDEKLFEKLDVGIECFQFYKDIIKASHDIVGMLPSNIIANGFVHAINAKALDLLAASKLARTDFNFPFSFEEIKRALNDVSFLLSSILAALGDGKVSNVHDTECNLKNGEKGKNNGYNVFYDVSTRVGSQAVDWDGYYYHTYGVDPNSSIIVEDVQRGSLKIAIDPDSRISFDYKPIRYYNEKDHTSETFIQKKDGGKTRYYNDALCMRIDIDKTAPCGIALDIGRSPYDSLKSDGYFSRTGDLLGRIFSKVSPDGCHEYSGFTTEMRDSFKPFAEELALNQYLRWSSNR